MTPKSDDREVERAGLLDGELTVIGRIRSASNATFLCETSAGVHCVYKPVTGEQPLWDFPEGTLAGREVAAYLISAELGWDLVPRTVLRDGPAGIGMVQRWVHQPELGSGQVDLVDICLPDAIPAGYLPVLEAVDADGAEIVLVHADDESLRRMAVFDILVNNADRKGGHVLRGPDGAVFGVDHGICLHTHDKLRTVLWGWAGKPIDDVVLGDVARLGDALAHELGSQLSGHISAPEVDALGRRVEAMLAHPVMAIPDGSRPIPWPAF